MPTLHRFSRSRKRRGVAAVEAALTLPLLFLIIFGVWELGRLVQVSQIVSNSAREGARLAATGNYSCSTVSGTNPTFQVQQAVGNYIQNAGLPIVDGTIIVTVKNLTKNWTAIATISTDGSNSTNVIGVTSGGSSSSDPVLSAEQMDDLVVEVSYPYQFARWSPMNWYFYLADTTTAVGSARWPCMRDKPVVIDASIPQNP